jgi:hypothetical protein
MISRYASAAQYGPRLDVLTAGRRTVISCVGGASQQSRYGMLDGRLF